MTRIKPIDPNIAEGETKEVLALAQKQFGGIPNAFKTLASSHVVLEAFLGMSSPLARGSLTPALREQIALAVAGKNNCDYCASAHTAIGEMAGLSTKEMALNLKGKSQESTTQCILEFVNHILESRGQVYDIEFIKLKELKLTDAEISEIVAHTAMNIFTTYYHMIAKTEIDYPLVKAQNKQFDDY
ncbi:carboxymuconolactone decarboxylase family protein [Pseudoalteromonas luteoviolacea]|uniref:carboxymuconolactone decarboxylase family protein n=1 Tax=Pseudoalteromonas luteoviolacea TaxID=43657 RepID=UPI001B388797|nr:carboxymuconolactone decarboxylase family protein [Pseudoalteromonas luteoviolacea]MBQ4836690.1 carboxymuconolactone decarboxylase family protein [Pseudoalteromonas luteoviolacea]